MATPRKKPRKALVIVGILGALAVFGHLAKEETGEVSYATIPEPEPSKTKPSEPEPEASPSPSTPTSPPEPKVPSTPTKAQLAMDKAYHEAYRDDPSANNYKRVARKLDATPDEVLEAVSVVAEYREALLEDTRNSVTGIVGDLDIKSIQRTDLGTHTAIASFTATGCPEGDPRRDEDLEFLAKNALQKLVAGLPEPVDSFRVSLWYRGVSCSRGSMGYRATWTREGNDLTLK